MSEQWQALIDGRWEFVDDVRLLITSVRDDALMTVSGYYITEHGHRIELIRGGKDVPATSPGSEHGVDGVDVDGGNRG